MTFPTIIYSGIMMLKRRWIFDATEFYGRNGISSFQL
jgi:hypothetical protein